MADLKISYDKTLANEGGWSLNKNDFGKETMNGIARNFFPNWNGWRYIDAVKKDGVPDFSQMPADKKVALEIEVQNFYREEFWKRIQGDRIPISLQSIADEMFDTSVNMGVQTAIMFLQDALNVLNRNGKSYADVDVDGRMGGNTLNALKYYENRAGERQLLLKIMNVLQGGKYVEIMRKNSSQENWARGWFNRVTI